MKTRAAPATRPATTKAGATKLSRWVTTSRRSMGKALEKTQVLVKQPNFIIPTMAVWALGINHTTAPLDLRSRFAYAIDQVEPTLKALRGSFARQPEAAILSTCNRTEIYCAGERGDVDQTFAWLAQSG